MEVAADTKLDELLKVNKDATMGVLAKFGVIHCMSCEVDGEKTVAEVAAEKGLPAEIVARSLAAEVKP